VLVLESRLKTYHWQFVNFEVKNNIQTKPTYMRVTHNFFKTVLKVTYRLICEPTLMLVSTVHQNFPMHLYKGAIHICTQLLKNTSIWMFQELETRLQELQQEAQKSAAAKVNFECIRVFTIPFMWYFNEWDMSFEVINFSVVFATLFLVNDIQQFYPVDFLCWFKTWIKV
jgi:hypothetical protein